MSNAPRRLSAVPNDAAPDPPVRVLRAAWHGSEAEFLQALQDGGGGAWSIFYDRFAGMIHATVRRQLGRDDSVEDLVQDALHRLVSSVKSVRDPECLPGWVRAVTINTVRSELRRRYVRRILHFDSAALDRVEGDAIDHDGRALLRSVYSVLDQMSPELRIVFVLRYIDEHSLAEVAETCDWSLATTKRKLSRAQQRFARLAEQLPELRARLEGGERWT